jgi:hypothetical protein
MFNKKDLTTADLARPREDMHGRGDERLEARERPATEDRPDIAATDRRGPTTPDAPREEFRDTPRMERPVTHQSPQALFPADEASAFHSQWSGIQSGFVDEPRTAVERADSLVAEVMQKLAASFAAERATLERQWDRGTDVTTEDLRLTLQRYRAFFDRLLKV